MIHYDTLSRRPSAFRSMTGFSVEMFHSLFLAFTRAYEDQKHASKTTKRDGKPRQRAPGAGRRYAHDLRDRLLMTLIWLRTYPTFEVLGFLFDLHKANVCDNVARCWRCSRRWPTSPSSVLPPSAGSAAASRK